MPIFQKTSKGYSIKKGVGEFLKYGLS